MQIVLDAMGSDNQPIPDVAGAVQAAREHGDTIILVGDEARLKAELAKHRTAGLKLEIEPASQQILMTDKPADILKGKPDSSMHVGLRLVKEGRAEAFVTAGNTGAVLAVAMLNSLGRIRGVKRPALGVTFPNRERPFLIDGGANADCKPEHLLQFAIMGSLYIERVVGVTRPRVALLANGEEEGKGNSLIQESFALIAQSNLNFIGNIEPKDFTRGGADVTVTDGFTGNITLKTVEAIASYMKNNIAEELRANLVSSLGGLLSKRAFRRVAANWNPDFVGGVPLLGVNGVVIIGHGRSNDYAIRQAIGQARLAVQQDIVSAIANGLA